MLTGLKELMESSRWPLKCPASPDMICMYFGRTIVESSSHNDGELKQLILMNVLLGAGATAVGA